jgi:hypothetical protein
MLIRNHQLSIQSSFISAITIIIFELVEVSVIGSPEGIARNLQLLYFGLGIIIGSLSIILRVSEKQIIN